MENMKLGSPFFFGLMGRSAPARLRAVVAAWLCISSLMAGAMEERAEPGESEVKAAFLYKFLGFVDWPERVFVSPAAPLVVGVLGADDVESRLQQLVPGRAVKSHPIVVRHVKSHADSFEGLHAIYVGHIDGAWLDDVAVKAQALSILAVSDSPDGTEYGFVINFLLDEGRVRFDVSTEAAQASKLVLSSRLLAVAHRVKSGGK